MGVQEEDLGERPEAAEVEVQGGALEESEQGDFDLRNFCQGSLSSGLNYSGN